MPAGHPWEAALHFKTADLSTEDPSAHGCSGRYPWTKLSTGQMAKFRAMDTCLRRCRRTSEAWITQNLSDTPTHYLKLPPMTHETDFISHALRCISSSVSDILGRTELHVCPKGLSQRVAQRTRAQLKGLEQMLRRVIMLIAITMSERIKPTPLARPHISLLDAIRLAPLRSTKARKQSRPRDPMLPAPRCTMGDVDFSTLPKDKPRKPVNLRKLIKRIRTLQAVLENPEPMARRLATHYARLRRLQTKLPTAPPEIPLRRASAELSLVAGALPMELRRATRVWNDSG